MFGAALHVRRHPEQRARLCAHLGAEFPQNNPGWDGQSQLCSCPAIPGWVKAHPEPALNPSRCPRLLQTPKIRDWAGSEGTLRNPGKNGFYKGQHGLSAVPKEFQRIPPPREFSGIVQPLHPPSSEESRSRRGKAEPRWIPSMSFPKHDECPGLSPGRTLTWRMSLHP